MMDLFTTRIDLLCFAFRTYTILCICRFPSRLMYISNRIAIGESTSIPLLQA